MARQKDIIKNCFLLFFKCCLLYILSLNSLYRKHQHIGAIMKRWQGTLLIMLSLLTLLPLSTGVFVSAQRDCEVNLNEGRRWRWDVSGQDVVQCYFDGQAGQVLTVQCENCVPQTFYIRSPQGNYLRGNQDGTVTLPENGRYEFGFEYRFVQEWYYPGAEPTRCGYDSGGGGCTGVDPNAGIQYSPMEGQVWVVLDLIETTAPPLVPTTVLYPTTVPAPTATPRAVGLNLQQICSLSEEGRSEEALVYYNQLASLGASAYDYTWAWSCFYFAEDYEHALVAINHAIELRDTEGSTDNSKRASDYSMRGQAYAELGELDAALADFEYAIQLDPNQARIFANAANVHMMLGNTEKAIEYMRRAAELDPRGITLSHPDLSGDITMSIPEAWSVAPVTSSDIDGILTSIYPSADYVALFQDPAQWSRGVKIENLSPGAMRVIIGAVSKSSFETFVTDFDWGLDYVGAPGGFDELVDQPTYNICVATPAGKVVFTIMLFFMIFDVVPGSQPSCNVMVGDHTAASYCMLADRGNGQEGICFVLITLESGDVVVIEGNLRGEEVNMETFNLVTLFLAVIMQIEQTPRVPTASPGVGQ